MSFHHTDEHTLAELVIDLDAIAHNVRIFVAAAAPAEVMAVVKADGYNHGMEQVAQTVLDAGATQLGVATIAEALDLRSSGISAPVTAWMWYPGEDLTKALDQRITIGIPSLAHAKDLLRQLSTQPRQQTPVACLMFDSGLSRSGVGPQEWEDTVALLAQAEGEGALTVAGIMTHLAIADTEGGKSTTDLQAARFQGAIDYCREQGLRVPTNHMANTPAVLTRKDTNHEMVRPGVGIYGVDPVEPQIGADLRPAMTLRARVLTTRVVPAGEGVSYGHLWRAQEDTRTAVVGIGYADGLPRSISGNFDVCIDGQRYPQIGRVCMDQVVVDLGPVAQADAPGASVQPGDWAVIFGEGGPTVDELAERIGTITYEVLTMPRCRVRRRFLPVTEGAVGDWDFSTPSRAVAATDQDMRELGRQMGEQLEAGTVVVLTGPLGAGKTTLAQGIAQGLGVKGRVQSPTFTIVRTHKPGEPGRPGMLHMDAYRLLGEDVAESIEPGKHADPDMVSDALESLDLDADLDDVVVVAEWGRGVVEQLSDRVLDVMIERGSEQCEDETRVVSWTWR